MPIDRSSVERHDQHYSKETVEEVKAHIDKLTKSGTLINKDNPILDVILTIPDEIKIAVDIGSGVGWGSNYLSQKFDRVYGIEPSVHAMKTAQSLYGKSDKIVWINGFAEEELRKLELETPALFYTACVLSHLTDETVSQICSAVNEIAKPGSYLSFSENWSRDLHQHLWHSRTTDWWGKQFPDWNLTFRDVDGAPSGVKKV